MLRSALRLLALAGLLAGAFFLPSPGSSSDFDARQGLDTFDAAWQAVRDSYYDTTFAGMDWDSLGAAYRERAARAESAEEVRGLIRDLIAELGDSHFAVLSRSPLAGSAQLDWRRVVSPGGATVGVIRFNAWMLSAAREFDAAMDSLRGADGIVVDLRGNGGGLIPMLMGTSGHFLSEPALLGTLVSRNNRIEIRANPRRVDGAGNYVEPYSGPLIVLVNARSYSASEFFAAGMQGLGRAVIVGEATTGQALGATYTMLPGGDVLEHAISDFLAAGDVRVEGNGVQPDLVAAEDPLSRALSVVDARRIVDRYAALTGGREALDACPEYVAEGTMSLPAQGLSGSLIIYGRAPNHMVVNIEMPGLGGMSSGYDGETGWMIQPMVGPMLLEGRALEQLRVQSRQDDMLKAHDGVRAVELAGPRDIDGVSARGVRVLYDGGFETVEYYHPETGMLLGMLGEQDTPMGVLKVFTKVLGHVSCGPVRAALNTSQELMGMEQVVRIDTCACTAVADSVFALPPAIQVLKDNR